MLFASASVNFSGILNEVVVVKLLKDLNELFGVIVLFVVQNLEIVMGERYMNECFPVF